MKRALRLARRAMGRTSPNPMVGAVIVKDGRIIAEDYHRKAGEPHAEALALAGAGEEARGATLYVTLEPCCHRAKRTPPCTDGILSAGISRVVAAMQDPNPRVAGKGIAMLREHGVDAESGLFRDEAHRLNEAYIKYIITGVPFVILKIAMTIDGKIAMPDGESKWITGPASRRLVHKLRSGVDAILTAIGTVKADDPELTSRIRGGRNPLRVVIDPGIEVPLDARIVRTPPGTIMVTHVPADGDKSKISKLQALRERGVEILFYDTEKADIGWLVSRLGERGITSILIEGGSSLNAYALHSGVVDKVMIFVAPKIIAGKKSVTAVGGESVKSLGQAYHLSDLKTKRLGEDLAIEAYVEHASQI